MKKLNVLHKPELFPAIILLIILSAGCKNDAAPATADATDYSISSHWLALPANPGKPVDVFYLYPTAWTTDSLTNPLYSEINNPSMLAGSALAFNSQATAFETAGNVYAPYYRQANAARTLVLGEDQRWEIQIGRAHV